MRYLISKKQYKVLLEQTDPKRYPACVASETSNPRRGKIKTTKTGANYIEIFIMGLEGYRFYSNSRVMYPDGRMGNYSCRGRDILVDGVDIAAETFKNSKWSQETDYERRERERAIAMGDRVAKNLEVITDFYQKYNHEVNTVLAIGTAFIPLVGPFISAGIGLADAAQYYNEGETKMAGMIGLFSLIPGIGSLAGKISGKLSAKAMGEIGKKVATKQALTASEAQIVNKVAQYRPLIQAEIAKQAASKGIPVTTQVATQAVRQSIKGQAKKELAKNTAKTVGTFAAAGTAYSKGYDYVQRDTPKVMAEKEGLNWDFVKSSFGSTGTAEDNKLLTQAWKEGWRPGQVVPEKFQLQKFKDTYKQETDDIGKLQQLVANAQKQN